MPGFVPTARQLFNAHDICASIAGLAVAMRIFCKVRFEQGVRADDYWIVAALLFYYAAAEVMSQGVSFSPAEQ
jgi:hypothetical protein